MSPSARVPSGKQTAEGTRCFHPKAGEVKVKEHPCWLPGKLEVRESQEATKGHQGRQWQELLRGAAASHFSAGNKQTTASLNVHLPAAGGRRLLLLSTSQTSGRCLSLGNHNRLPLGKDYGTVCVSPSQGWEEGCC